MAKALGKSTWPLIRRPRSNFRTGQHCTYRWVSFTVHVFPNPVLQEKISSKFPKNVYGKWNDVLSIHNIKSAEPGQ